MKKSIVIAFSFLAIVAVYFGVSQVFKVHAATLFVSKNLFKPTTIANKQVDLHGSMKLVLVDTSEVSEPQSYNLPSVVDNDGVVYNFKRNGTSPVQRVELTPAVGESIDGYAFGIPMPEETNAWVTLVADEAAGKWWILNWGSIQF